MAMSGSAATVTRNPRFSESTATRAWRTRAESSTTSTFNGLAGREAGTESVSAESRCLSELTFFPIHETPIRVVSGPGAPTISFSREPHGRGAGECRELRCGTRALLAMDGPLVRRTVIYRPHHASLPH